VSRITQLSTADVRFPTVRGGQYHAPQAPGAGTEMLAASLAGYSAGGDG
jgi:vacuolar-type H+-ATPase catalytic subunit A/Vma1